MVMRILLMCTRGGRGKNVAGKWGYAFENSQETGSGEFPPDWVSSDVIVAGRMVVPRCAVSVVKK